MCSRAIGVRTFASVDGRRDFTPAVVFTRSRNQLRAISVRYNYQEESVDFFTENAFRMVNYAVSRTRTGGPRPISQPMKETTIGSCQHRKTST